MKRTNPADPGPSLSQRATASWVYGTLCLLFLIGVFCFAPAELPETKHRVVGLLAAFAAGFLGYFMSGAIGIDGTTNLGSYGKLGLKAGGGLALFIVVLYWWNSPSSPSKVVKEVQAVSDKVDLANLRLAAITVLLSEFNQPKPSQPGQEKLSPDLLEKAKQLLERGDKKQKAIAAIALKQPEQAATFIADLKKDAVSEAFEVLTLEGDNFYNANLPDKAIESYVQALALKRDSLVALNSLAIAHLFARLGNVAEHRTQAIKLLERAAVLAKPHSPEWAMVEDNLALAWDGLPTGDRAENGKKAIACYEAALTVETKEAFPIKWATTQNNLAIAWQELPGGDHSENIKKAIADYEAALTVRTKEAFPAYWAETQANLANAWGDLPTGDRAENVKKAIAGHEAALTVWTKETFPTEWAHTQINLANAWSTLPTGHRAENVEKAIAGYEAALTVWTKETFPADWASTQNNLAIAWKNLPTGDRTQNLKKAIAGLEAALTVRTKKAFPAKYAETSYNLARTYNDLAFETQPSDRTLQLKARDLARVCLSIWTETSHPDDHADALSLLALLDSELNAVEEKNSLVEEK